MLREGRCSVAHLLASCLVSKGVGVDGTQDRLTVLSGWFRCRCQKKSERLACHASLTKHNDGQNKGIFVAQGKVKNVKGKKVARHTFVAQGKVRNATKVGGLNYILKFLSCTSNRIIEVLKKYTSASKRQGLGWT